jgi:glycosyltransferase involved in cell wall biosynthesis
MPARNAARFIGEAIESVLTQGAAVNELIVVDDGSMDDTVAILHRLSRPRVRLLTNNRAGVSAARNTGARAASGKWLIFLDADDRLRPGAIHTLLKAADGELDAVSLYGDYDRIDDTGRRVGRRRLLRRRRKPSGRVLQRLVVGNFIVNGGLMLVRASAFNAVGGFDETLRFCEDWHCWCRLAAIGTFHFVPDFLLDYRIHDANTMSSGRRSPEDFLPAAERVFQDQTIIEKLPPQLLPRLRQAAEAHLIAYLATQAVRVRGYATALAYASMAVRRSPRAAPGVILRLASAFVGI